MVDEIKSIRDQLLKTALGAVSSIGGNSDAASNLKDIISSLASIAGKGKDEIVQIISREIGIAVAGVIKEPILQILEEKKLQITIELADTKRISKKNKSKKS